MLRSMYASVSSMLTLQSRQSIITNNLANVNTTGYKSQTLVAKSFDSMLLHNKDNYKNGVSQVNELGSLNFGVRIDETATNYNQGTLISTDNNTDFAIVGSGFFEVTDEQNNTYYTRDGSFKISADGYLVTSEGYTVMGENGSINVGQEDFTVSEIGEIIDKNGDTIDRFSIKSFAQKERIEKVGNNMVKVPDDIESKDFEGGVKQGFLESSNVNSVEEMVDMIAVMRSYEANQKILQAHDELLGKSVNQLGSLS